MLPNDEEETIRLDLLHEVMTKEDRQQDVSGAGGWEQDIQDSGHGDWDRYLRVEESCLSRVIGWADENTGAMEVANSFPNAEISLCLSPIEHGWGAER